MNIAAVLLAISVASAPNEPTAAIAEPELMMRDGDRVYPITVEEYVTGVVANEVPYTFHTEALRAQAVAARSYLYYCLENNSHPHENADVCTDSTHCCGYTTEAELAERFGENYAREAIEVSRAAAEATAGEVMVYDGEIILALWHASSSGYTAACGEVLNPLPYLVSVRTTERTDVSTASFTLDEVRERLRRVGYTYNMKRTFRYVPTDSGRCESLTLGNVGLTGREVREIFGLRSTDFIAWFSREGLEFRVFGYGHGIGMSQQGAEMMAKDGYSYADILEYYYRGAVLSR